MTGSGTDIWGTADEFHFAYRTLTSPGTIVAKVESVEWTDNWAKAGVMIRETLDPGSKFAMVVMTPTNADGGPTKGCRFQARTDTDIGATSDTSVATPEQMSLTTPHWVKLERDFAGNFRGSYSSDGTTWQSMVWRPSITMTSTVYVGLALTSHNAARTCEATFSNVTITGNVTGQWQSQDIGIAGNAAEPLYVAVSNATGAPAVVVHDDPGAANIDAWTEWVIPLQAFADQGINLANVDKIAIGLGATGGAASGGSGKIFIDDIRLYARTEAAGTKEYRFTDAPRDVRDNDWTWCYLYIEDAGTIVDLDVKLNLDHEYGSDLEVAIFPPGMIDLAAGVRLSVYDRSWTDGMDTLFDDEAPPDGWPRHRQPVDSLSVFDGTNVRGEWTLLITDLWPGDAGILNSWSLVVEVQE
jgi:subtilisin-like proprotein convertase family protein